MKKLFENSDAVIITSPSNLFYFSKYSNADAAILLTDGAKYYFSDKRVLEEVSTRLKDFSVIDSGSDSPIKAATDFAVKKGCKSLGYEDAEIKLCEYMTLDESGLELIEVSGELSKKRAVKTAEEIEKIKASQRITDRVFEILLAEIKPDITEKELSARLNSLIYSFGAELAFDTIAAFGKNTSKPHAHPSDNKLQKDDVITLDFGAKLDGYCSDMTRSFGIGRVSVRYREDYQLVLEAQRLALDTLKSGMTGKEGDAVARELFKMHGKDEFFTHSLGHSLGIDIHESPVWSPRSERVVPENAVLSVEPGLYFNGEYGIRIEDIAVFNKYGSYNLTNAPKELIIL